MLPNELKHGGAWSFLASQKFVLPKLMSSTFQKLLYSVTNFEGWIVLIILSLAVEVFAPFSFSLMWGFFFCQIPIIILSQVYHPPRQESKGTRNAFENKHIPGVPKAVAACYKNQGPVNSLNNPSVITNVICQPILQWSNQLNLNQIKLIPIFL